MAMGPVGDLEMLKEVTRQADILFVAVGSPELVRRDWVKPGAVVVDIGINVVPYDATRGAARVPTRGKVDVQVVGDVDFDAVASVASAITPVPGGIGPMTIAALLENTFVSYLRARKRERQGTPASPTAAAEGGGGAVAEGAGP